MNKVAKTLWPEICQLLVKIEQRDNERVKEAQSFLKNNKMQTITIRRPTFHHQQKSDTRED